MNDPKFDLELAQAEAVLEGLSVFELGVTYWMKGRGWVTLTKEVMPNDRGEIVYLAYVGSIRTARRHRLWIWAKNTELLHDRP